ncbi:MAG TPA: hypothetical protein VG167_16635 [Verrucomicrobiae bacterium]|nr:hypothetical protein [Verrucomicrobiae bacterium]
MNPNPAPERLQLCAGRFLALVREGHWEYADRVNATGAAIILAVTAENKLLLVEQSAFPLVSQPQHFQAQDVFVALLDG